jgi:nucleoside-diphosphate-sugar epimerase
MANRTLVTGGCGFVGWNLVDALKARGDEVTVVDVQEEAHRSDVRYIKSSITDLEAMREAVDGMDTVIHNASLVHTKWTKADVIWDVNLGGSEKILQACQEQGVPKLIYISSASAVYEGRDIENGDERLPYSSISQAPYADSKIAAERLMLSASGEKGVQICAIRPHVVFGPGDNRFMPAILDKAYAGALKFGVGRERKLSDFTYISNLTDAVQLVDEHLGEGGVAAGQVYFITNGEPTSFFDFVDEVLVRIGLPKVRWMVPGGIVYAVAAVNELIDKLKGGELDSEDGLTRFAIRYVCTHHYFSIERAKRELGYEPRVSIVEGIDRTVDWLRENGQLR